MGDPYSGRPFKCPNCNALCDTIAFHEARCRNASQAIIECIGARGPENVEDSANRIVAAMDRGNKEAVKLMEEVERLRGELEQANKALGNK